MIETLRERLLRIAGDHRKSVDTVRVFVGYMHDAILLDAADRDATASFFMAQLQNEGSFPDPAVFIDSVQGNSANASKVVNRISELASMQRRFPGVLLEMAFIYRVALFDAFIPDVLTTLLVGKPEMLKSKKQMTHQEILEQRDLARVVELMAHKEIQEFAKGSVREQGRWVNDRIGMDLFSNEEQLEQVIELIARRNVFVHANGYVDRRYLAAVSEAVQMIGCRLQVPEPYWAESDECLTKVSDHLLEEILSKFCST